jgi:hypothetical protein
VFAPSEGARIETNQCRAVTPPGLRQQCGRRSTKWERGLKDNRA